MAKGGYTVGAMAVPEPCLSPEPRRCVLTQAALRGLRDECMRVGKRREACALLFGGMRGDTLYLDRVRAIPNRALSSKRFRVDVAALADATTLEQRAPRALFHSHPSSLYPSRADLRSIGGSALVWLIGAVRADTDELEIRAYARAGRWVRAIPTKVGGE